MGLSIPTAIATTSKALTRPGYVSTQQLEAIAQEIRDLTAKAEKLILRHDASDLAARLTAGSWCVAECLDHLAQTTRVFLPVLSSAIAQAPRFSENRHLRTGFVSSLFIWNLTPPYRIRFSVLPQLEPRSPHPTKAWADFADSQRELLEVLRSTAGLAIDKIKIKSPMYARLNYNVFGAFRMLAAHQNRHVWQIERILTELDRHPTYLANSL